MTDAAPVAAPDGETLRQLRLGIHPGPWHGFEVIGYDGIAVWCGFKTRAGQPNARTVRGLAKTDPRFPRAVFRVPIRGAAEMLLFPAGPARKWAIQAGCLEPDGVTPRRRKPHRGPSRARRGG